MLVVGVMMKKWGSDNLDLGDKTKGDTLVGDGLFDQDSKIEPMGQGSKHDGMYSLD